MKPELAAPIILRTFINTVCAGGACRLLAGCTLVSNRAHTEWGLAVEIAVPRCIIIIFMMRGTD